MNNICPVIIGLNFSSFRIILLEVFRTTHVNFLSCFEGVWINTLTYDRSMQLSFRNGVSLFGLCQLFFAALFHSLKLHTHIIFIHHCMVPIFFF